MNKFSEYNANYSDEAALKPSAPIFEATKRFIGTLLVRDGLATEGLVQHMFDDCFDIADVIEKATKLYNGEEVTIDVPVPFDPLG